MTASHAALQSVGICRERPAHQPQRPSRRGRCRPLRVHTSTLGRCFAGCCAATTAAPSRSGPTASERSCASGSQPWSVSRGASAGTRCRWVAPAWRSAAAGRRLAVARYAGGLHSAARPPPVGAVPPAALLGSRLAGLRVGAAAGGDGVEVKAAVTMAGRPLGDGTACRNRPRNRAPGGVQRLRTVEVVPGCQPWRRRPSQRRQAPTAVAERARLAEPERSAAGRCRPSPEVGAGEPADRTAAVES